MTMVRNLPPREERIRENRALYAKLEREAEEAEGAGNESWARELYSCADNVYALIEDDRRQERREAAARVRNMEIEDVLTGRVLDD